MPPTRDGTAQDARMGGEDENGERGEKAPLPSSQLRFPAESKGGGQANDEGRMGSAYLGVERTGITAVRDPSQ